ncbi:DNA phosphorothioation-dependent restriction protein DptG [Clostridium aciditolerans]|uniref:DNA phosphorothioation-dependent restriction protein DptG n=1 Tax=Clostridium aciditolerans TaxID=339861 RepID=A0A934M5A6_9CLOT|nr:DNA phosphorothioation-dependent restriction protein DptG [Clostridium aciditolerans]MBI6874890.1 DNA phosphorothioation-dependent restriction protein DptG [Clostridium aciditolerans]
MSENMHFEIQIDQIKKKYRMNNGGIQHNYEKWLLPYVVTKEIQMTEFSGVMGAFSRIICNKELNSEFDVEEFIRNVEESIEKFEGKTSKEALRNIIKTMFIDKNNNLVNFDLKTINYISASKEDIKFAEFLYSIFYDYKLNTTINEHYNKNSNNILNKLVLQSLPKLVDKEYKMNQYKCYLPYIKDLFIKDFKYLIQNEELYKNNLKRFLEYYYLFYVSQLSMKLNKFEKADFDKNETLYFTLSWESISKNRTGYKFGLEKLIKNVSSLFSHTITLDLINYHNLENKLTYKEIFDLLQTVDEGKAENEINNVYDMYIEAISDIRWIDVKLPNKDTQNKAFNKILKLFSAIDYQFNNTNTNRKDMYKFYANKFLNFINKSFGKRRGSLGWCLTLNEEDIIFLTKLSINNNERLKLSSLFAEFEKRGISFDRDSQAKIIQLYEKLNLLEKKSDSGDAQYVRSIL